MPAICKLCLELKELCKKSHIIPEFMYKHSGLYDEKHRLLSFSIEQLSKGAKPNMPQKGAYDSGLLCYDCDNRRLGSNLEDYAKNAIFGGEMEVGAEPIAQNFEQPDGRVVSIITNLNYMKFKLFLLSLLWRASITKHAFFKNITLGEHEEVLRKAIYEANPMSCRDYPILVLTSATDDFETDIIIEPQQYIDDSDGMLTCFFFIGAFMYFFKIGVYADIPEIRQSTINEENMMHIFHNANGQTRQMVMKLVGL